MDSFSNRIRMFFAAGVVAAVFVAVAGFVPTVAVCQEGDDCEVGEVTTENREDGSLWICATEFECEDRKGKNVCFRLA